MTQLTHSLRTGSSQTSLLTSSSRLLVRWHEFLGRFLRFSSLLLDARIALSGSYLGLTASQTEDVVIVNAAGVTTVTRRGRAVLLANLLLVFAPENVCGLVHTLISPLDLLAVASGVGIEGISAFLERLLLCNVIAILGRVTSVESIQSFVAHGLQTQ